MRSKRTINRVCLRCSSGFLAIASTSQQFCSRRCANTRPIEDRFWLKVDQSGGGDACWPWTGKRRGNGYGVLWDGGEKPTHRVAYELTIGPIPEGLVIRHKCDNPPCCNPRHLEIGTVAENNRDTAERGRSTMGEKNARAVLTNDEVREIRMLRAGGTTLAVIAQRFGIGVMTVSHIVRRNTWKHIA